MSSYIVGELMTPDTVGDMGQQDASGVSITGGTILNVYLGTPRLKFSPYSVATLPDATQQSYEVYYVSDGDGGSPCIAVSDGSTWRRIAFGATVST